MRCLAALKKKMQLCEKTVHEPGRRASRATSAQAIESAAIYKTEVSLRKAFNP